MAASLMLVHPDGSKGKQLGISMSPHLLTEIPKGMVLSFHCLDYKGAPNADGVFTVGAATTEIRDFHHSTDGRWLYAVDIESPNVHDFSAALREVFRRLGKPIEDLTPPCMIHPAEQSFIRGVQNDFRHLVACVSSWWAGLRKQFGLHFMK